MTTITGQEQEAFIQQSDWANTFIAITKRLQTEAKTEWLTLDVVFAAMDEAGLWFTNTNPGYIETTN